MNCRNGEKFLYESISSIYSQTYQNFEIIFFDNCSTDNSIKIANKFDKRLKIFSAKKDFTLGEARKEAIKFASGDFIAFLDTDDIYLPNKLETQLTKLLKDKKHWGFSAYGLINGSGRITKRYCSVKLNSNENIFMSLLQNYVVNFQTLIIKRETLFSITNIFPEELKVSPDFNLVLKLALVSEPSVSDDCLAFYRMHGDQLKHISYKQTYEDYSYTIDELKNFDDINKVNLNALNTYSKKTYFYKAIYYASISKLSASRKNFYLSKDISVIFYMIWLISVLLPWGPKIIFKILRKW